MCHEDRELYKILFKNNNQSIQVPFCLNQENSTNIPLICSAKSNEILLLGHKTYVKLVDLVTRNSIVVDSIEDESVSAVGIGYYNNCIFIGSSRGTLRIFRIKSTITEFILGDQFIIKQFSSSVIQNVFSTDGDLVIVICMNEIQFYFINDALQESKALDNEQPLIHDIDANKINIIADQFPVVITACQFSHYSNQLVIALGDHNILIYTIIGDSIGRVIEKVKKLKAEEFGVIKNLSIHNDGKLIAYTQINFYNRNEFKIFVKDLKKYEKTILTHTQKDEGKSVEITFFPVSTRLLVAYDQKYFTIDIDSSEPDNIQNQNIQLFKAQAPVKNIYSLSQFQDFPNFLYIDEKGGLTTLVYDSSKIDQLQQIPFLYFVEQRLKETLGYKPIMEQFFQKMLLIGFTGVNFEEARQNREENIQSDIMFNGETYFEPYFERIGKWCQLKDYYSSYRKKQFCCQSNKENWPLKQITDWCLRRAPQLSDNSSIQDVNQQVHPFENSRLIEAKQQKGQIINEDIFQNQDPIREESYLLLIKLFENIKFQDKEIFFLGDCQYLFHEQFPFKRLVLEKLNLSDNIKYLDLSNNRIKIEYIQEITRLNQLQFLDLSSNQLGHYIQNDLNQNQFQIYTQLFTNIPIVSLRNNNFRDEHGEQIIQIFGNNTQIRVLDLSENFLFNKLTYNQLHSIIIKKLQYLRNTQALIIEFDPLISQRTMTQLTNFLINSIRRLIINAEKLKFFLYIVNSNQQIHWNQSLIQTYEELKFGEEDEIKSCFVIINNLQQYATLQSFKNCLSRMFENIKSNCKSCAYQSLCTKLIFKKYICCCCCIFLQTSIGKFVKDMLGIKTADYEYNETKDKLLEYFKSNIETLRIIFWINIVAFYFICIFVPFYFAEECNGVQWYGHYIYIFYAILVCALEFVLAQICINYGVTHDAYQKGSICQRIRNFLKDLVLSQLSKFDVYSDFCFIATVMSCGDHNFIGYISIAVMLITLSSTFTQLWALLTIKAGEAINYFDFVCNYCSFVEIHLVASLLERWTVQNQNDFLCIKGIPSRVYASILRSFAEDLPQFLLQLVYINITQQNNGLMLNLSLASSIISIIISLTKTLTITKANRIDDIIQMGEFKNKLQVREGDVDPKLKQELVDFLYNFPE